MFKLKLKRLYPLILLLVSFLLLILPFTWTKLNHVGGDDSKLYYLFPLEILKNFSLNIISDNGTGTWSSYTSPSYSTPFLAFILLIKTIAPFINTQLLMYGLTLALGFIFFYLILDIWVKNDNMYSFFGKIISGLFYILSPYLTYSLYLHRLMGIHLIATIPSVLYFFIRGIYEKKYVFIVVSAVIMSVFSNTLITLPYSGGVFLSILPLFLYIFLLHKKQFLLSAGVFFILFLLLNAHWMIILINSFFSSVASGDVISSISSNALRNGDGFLIKSVSQINNINTVVFNTFGSNRPTQSSTTVLGIIFIEVIAFAGLYLNRINKKVKEIYIIAITMLVVTFFLFSPNIGNWGVDLFLWLTHHVPGFIMFRNMYDKFGLALSISYALALGISLKIIADNVKNNVSRIVIFSLLIIILLINAKPLILADKFKYPIYTTKNSYDSITDFNSDFYDLVNYLKNVPDPSRYLWFPINKVNYVAIADAKLKNHYYIGISPIQYLTKKQDFTATMGLGSPYESGVGNKISESLFDKNYHKVGKYLQKLNVKYIILNKDVYKSKEIQNSFMYDGDFFDIQNNLALKKYLFGKKIKDFGTRYSLYEINNKYMNDKIYLTNDFNTISSDPSLNFEKKTNYEYKISIKNLTVEKKLVFLDPYYKGWSLYFTNSGDLVSKNIFVLNYANGWTINPVEIQKKYPASFYHKNDDGSINLELTLYFKPQKYFYIASMISILSLFGSLVYIILNFLNRRSRKA